MLRLGGIIKGRVLDKNGEPDGSASVMITSATPGQMFNWSSPTTVRGEFECTGLAAGSYRVFVHQREGQLQIFEIFKNQKNPQHIVTVSEGQTVVLDL